MADAAGALDYSVRWLVVNQMIADERLKEAAEVLGPLTYNPHKSQDTDAARKLLKVDRGQVEYGLRVHWKMMQRDRSWKLLVAAGRWWRTVVANARR
jgi:hypothetical protein